MVDRFSTIKLLVNLVIIWYYYKLLWLCHMHMTVATFITASGMLYVLAAIQFHFPVVASKISSCQLFLLYFAVSFFNSPLGCFCLAYHIPYNAKVWWRKTLMNEAHTKLWRAKCSHILNDNTVGLSHDSGYTTFFLWLQPIMASMCIRMSGKY